MVDQDWSRDGRVNTLKDTNQTNNPPPSGPKDTEKRHCCGVVCFHTDWAGLRSGVRYVLPPTYSMLMLF